jgi:hypothetical protein
MWMYFGGHCRPEVKGHLTDAETVRSKIEGLSNRSQLHSPNPREMSNQYFPVF